MSLFLSTKLDCSTQLVATIDSVSVLSSPRSVDLNNDGIKDVVIGSGTDSTYSNHGVVAINGANGQVLWTTQHVMKSFLVLNSWM